MRSNSFGALCAAFLCLFAIAALPETAFAAARASSRSSDLERQIAQEQEKAKSRRASLSRLTAEERAADRDLAALEAKILRLEASLEKEEKSLQSLAASDAELAEKGGDILAEQARIEEAMTEVLRVLWELHARRAGVKGRDLPDWPVTDREHSWATELFASLDEYRKELSLRRKELDAVAAKRAAIAGEVRARIAALNREKEEVLQSRVRYGRNIAELRKRKSDTEEELTGILDLVRNLNLRLQAAEEQGDMARARGKLPWPAEGRVRVGYKPSAQPPVRGITIGLGGDAPVRAVHWGKVVHNDVLRGIGRVVIIMHGEEFYSLYAFLSDSPVRIGQEVARGEVVGTSGFVPAINGPGLYFELRNHQKTVNPEEWLRGS